LRESLSEQTQDLPLAQRERRRLVDDLRRAAPHRIQHFTSSIGVMIVRAMTVRTDMADERQVQSMFAEAVRQMGTIDILVSNAGMERNAPFHEMTTAQWDAVMNVNLRGAFLGAREAVREFLRRGVRPDGLVDTRHLRRPHETRAVQTDR
jgi:NAD(P)-dependent dehydrogenase (short-subunit alcohol dehydrogenase family)